MITLPYLVMAPYDRKLDELVTMPGEFSLHMPLSEDLVRIQLELPDDEYCAAPYGLLEVGVEQTGVTMQRPAGEDGLRPPLIVEMAGTGGRRWPVLGRPVSRLMFERQPADGQWHLSAPDETSQPAIEHDRGLYVFTHQVVGNALRRAKESHGLIPPTPPGAARRKCV